MESLFLDASMTKEQNAVSIAAANDYLLMTFNNSQLIQGYITCDYGSYLSTDANSCIPCPSGTYQVGGY